ncbi:MAG: DUF3168 domain-containing protein [Brevundimonas sp.]|jgi:hypothetical protein|uniref:DUF3168 domain-containing protein n=1 Tax=Brevundimonas sp. TaxID=1871086 RepID=UPI003918D36C
MSTPGCDLIAGLIAALRADPMLSALCDDRIHDALPDRAVFPNVSITRHTLIPVRAEGAGTEHQIAWLVSSRFSGGEEALAIAEAMRVALTTAPSPEGLHMTGLSVTRAEVFPAPDRRFWHGLIQMRVMVETLNDNPLTP